MSENNEAAVTVTLKGGAGYEAPWLVLRGNTPAEVAGLLQNLGGLPEAVVSASNLFHAVHTTGPLLPNAPQTPAPAAPQQPAAPQGWAPAPPAAAPVVGHPEGKVCEACNAPLQFKSGVAKGSGKAYKLWSCPNGRSRNDGHSTLWVD